MQQAVGESKIRPMEPPLLNYGTPRSYEPKSPEPTPGFWQIVRTWEKLRLIYNAILAGIFGTGWSMAAVGGYEYLTSLALQFLAVLVAANTFFCAGPAASLGLRYLGLYRHGITVALFAVGLAFTIVVSVGAMCIGLSIATSGF